MDLTEETLKKRRELYKCVLCGSDLDEYGNCIINPYHTEEPS